MNLFVILNKIFRFLGSPFIQNYNFFLFLWILSSSVNFFNRFYFVGFTSGFFWSLFSYIECYLACLLLPLLNNSLRNLYKFILLILGLLNFTIDLFISLISTNSGFNEFVGLILGTNLNEVYEFFQHYFSYNIFLYLTICCKLSVNYVSDILRQS